MVDGRLAAASSVAPGWARGGIVLGLGSRFLNLAVAPDIGAYWQDGFSARLGLGSALTLAGYSSSVSLSARMESVGLEQGFHIDNLIRTGLELHFLPPELPLGLRIYGGINWDSPALSWMAGFGISGGL